MKTLQIIKASVITGMLTCAGLAIQPANAADLTVGANIGNVPWEFQDETGKDVGFEIDLVNEIAKQMGKSVEIVNIPFNGLFSAVQSGRINMAVSSITITDKRLESVTFAQPYYDSDQSLTALSSSGFTSLKDMENKVIGVDTGSTGDMWVTNNKAEYKLGEIRSFEGLSSAMLDLAAGRIDGYISDIPALQYYVKDKPELKVIERIPTGEKYSVMFKKNDPLANEVNDVISKLKEQGYIAKLHETWFGAKADEGTSTVKIMDMPAAK
ncbi:transporter substrate-binding domain-containing protein [Ochrobactrum sp. MR28]|uniref:Amino acid ABC transporter substrate-binding protein (PAAT family) n=2 Tax=Pseudochrobactrum asaccharolyticum TaxID=354351 RepID=A0A366E4E7_9HYPH|nr:transporter substrate-binding domain-containing protein [Ochrobactrum sp. MR28]MBX8817693.1 transporter substrate-binding domain-containing protein [Ochrobactrum sp. MR31]RBO97246.1 amino acid ABC transporter substrate-binding protein (PAAT family) [Pseudochrobactrum asaccharolyticum]